MVEQRAHAARVPVLGDRLGHRHGDLLYMVIPRVRNEPIDMPAWTSWTSFLFYALIVDFSLEVLDFIHRALRERGVDQDPRQAGGAQAVHEPGRPAGAARHADAARHPGAARKLRHLNDELRKLLYFIVGRS